MEHPAEISPATIISTFRGQFSGDRGAEALVDFVQRIWDENEKLVMTGKLLELEQLYADRSRGVAMQSLAFEPAFSEALFMNIGMSTELEHVKTVKDLVDEHIASRRQPIHQAADGEALAEVQHKALGNHALFFVVYLRSVLAAAWAACREAQDQGSAEFGLLAEAAHEMHNYVKELADCLHPRLLDALCQMCNEDLAVFDNEAGLGLEFPQRLCHQLAVLRGRLRKQATHMVLIEVFQGIEDEQEEFDAWLKYIDSLTRGSDRPFDITTAEFQRLVDDTENPAAIALWCSNRLFHIVNQALPELTNNQRFLPILYDGLRQVRAELD